MNTREPNSVLVRLWGEGRAEKKLTGVIRVTVGGDHAGAGPAHCALRAAGKRRSTRWLRGFRDASEPTRHETRPMRQCGAILWSSWARRLGARAG